MKCPNEKCGADDMLFLGANDFGSNIDHCTKCGTTTQGKKVFVPTQAKRFAALREAAEAGNSVCRAVEGAAMLSDNEERFGELVSEKLGLVQDAVTKLTAALALDAQE